MLRNGKTRQCTPIYYSRQRSPDRVDFRRRKIKNIDTFNSKPLQTNAAMEVDEVDMLLQKKLDELLMLKRQPMDVEAGSEKKQKLSWKDEINRRRKLVETFLLRQNQRNLAKACRWSGCSYALVKRVANDLSLIHI